jgi:hypothetical protein
VSLEINPDVIWLESDGEVRLYDSATGEFRTLNSTGSRIWALIGAGRSETEVIAEMAREHASDDAYLGEEVARDITEFLVDMVRQELLLRPVVTPEETGA